MTFSEKLLDLRKKQGMSQEELAEKLEVSRQAVSRWEQGSAMPDMINLSKISKLFGVTADYLINDEITSDREVPIVKKTESDMNNLAGKFFIFAGLQFLSPAFYLIWLLFFSRVLGRNTSTIVVCAGIIITIINFVLFEKSFGGQNNYRRKYYILASWMSSLPPIIMLTLYISKIVKLEYTIWTILPRAFIVYLVFCVATSIILNRRMK